MSVESDSDKLSPLEMELWQQGKIVIGLDEVGRGCLAGPVASGAFVLGPKAWNKILQTDRHLVRDSKKLSRAQKLRVEVILKNVSDSFAIGVCTPKEIDTMGIVVATFESMRRALFKLLFHPKLLKTPAEKLMLIVDGPYKIPGLNFAQTAVIDGDQICRCISAASILAKNFRDQFMIDIAPEYPEYGFEKHVGYGTQYHLASLKSFGPTDLHRKSFAPVRKSVSVAPLL